MIHAGEACRDKEGILNKEGLITFSVLPPKRLYHPVRSFRCNNKLLFYLCKSCATEQNFEECGYETVAKRALTYTWVIEEFSLAVQKVYEVLEILSIRI